MPDGKSCLFEQKGSSFASLSPFNSESKPSFVVRCVDGHWLFKDFSSGLGGSLIDFVMNKQKLNEVSEAIEYIKNMIGGGNLSENSAISISAEETKKPYNIHTLYSSIKGNDINICKSYLSERGISDEVIKSLEDLGILLHNYYKEASYCCFAVFDYDGELQCLDNHQIEGTRKFTLGKKEIFSQDWAKLSKSEEVFVTEGIIDYLSVKTLEGLEFCGIALLGSTIQFSPEIVSEAKVIMSALDSDDAGVRAFLDLQEHLPGKQFSVYQMGDSKDPNEYLQSTNSKNDTHNLTAAEKLELYKEFISSPNKSSFTSKRGISRAYMYQIAGECEEMILNGYKERQVGRKSKNPQLPLNLNEAHARIVELEKENKEALIKKEQYYARSEFLKLRLKWSEIENVELSGDVDPGIAEKPLKKKHLKKKRKTRL